jgi:hypothetical protein
MPAVDAYVFTDVACYDSKRSISTAAPAEEARIRTEELRLVK